MQPSTTNHLLLTALDPNSTEELAVAAIHAGAGLRFYAPELGLEPISACARRGWREAFALLLEKSHFEPHESALDQAMRMAARSGHASMAIDAWSFGACLDLETIFFAAQSGHASCIFELIASGAATGPSSKPLARGSRLDPCLDFEDVPSDLDYLFDACASEGLDFECARCIQLGVDIFGGSSGRHAALIAKREMRLAATAWLGSGAPIPLCAEKSWNRAFPALILALHEKSALSGAMSMPAAASASRL